MSCFNEDFSLTVRAMKVSIFCVLKIYEGRIILCISNSGCESYGTAASSHLTWAMQPGLLCHTLLEKKEYMPLNRTTST